MCSRLTHSVFTDRGDEEGIALGEQGIYRTTVRSWYEIAGDLKRGTIVIGNIARGFSSEVRGSLVLGMGTSESTAAFALTCRRVARTGPLTIRSHFKTTWDR